MPEDQPRGVLETIEIEGFIPRDAPQEDSEKDKPISTTVIPQHNYLILDEKERIFYDHIKKMQKEGKNVMVMSRRGSLYVEDTYGVDLGKDIMWLSKINTSGSISPSNLGLVSYTLMDYVKSHKNAVVGIEGIEYLILNNDFLKVLRVLDDISEVCTASEGSLLLTIDPETLEDDERALLERNLDKLGPYTQEKD